MVLRLDGQDTQIAQNLGSLEGYLSGRGYSSAQVAMGADGLSVVRDTAGIGAVTQPGAYDHYAAQGVAGYGGQPGTLTQPGAQPQPTISVEDFNRLQEYASTMEQVALQKERDRMAMEEQNFLYSIQHLPEDDQRVAILVRQNELLGRANTGLSQTLQQQQEQQEAAEQNEAKQDVGRHLATQAGLNWYNEDVQGLLMSSQTREEMDRNVRLLAGRYGSGQPQQPHQAAPQQTYPQGVPQRQRLPNGQFAPAGYQAAPQVVPMDAPFATQAQRAAFVAAGAVGTPAQGVSIREGDLMGYLAAKRGYQTVMVE